VRDQPEQKWRQYSLTAFSPSARAHSAEPARFHMPLPSPLAGELGPAAVTGELLNTCSAVAFNDMKHLARSIPADSLEAQDVVPPLDRTTPARRRGRPICYPQRYPQSRASAHLQHSMA